MVKIIFAGSGQCVKPWFEMIKRAGFVSIAASSLILSACQPAPVSAEDPETAPSVALAEPEVSDRLMGTWDVALYFSPGSPPSATVMEITAVRSDGTLEGNFYQSAFELARYVVREDQLIISVVTSDGSGRYQTSGRLSPSGEFRGQTHSIGRDFLMPWTAERR